MEDGASTSKSYCVKCRGHVVVTAPKRIVMKSGRHAEKGKCPHCGTATFKIVSAK